MNRIQWERDVPFFKNRFILNGIAIAIGIPLGGIIILMLVLSKGALLGKDTTYFFGLVAIFTIQVTVLLLALYCGRYVPGYIVDDEGIVNYSQQKQAKSNRLLNILLIIFGLFRGSYAPVGAGYAALSRQVMRIEWQDVKKVRYYPKQCAIVVQGGFTEKLVVFCNKSNYESVGKKIREKIEQNSKI